MQPKKTRGVKSKGLSIVTTQVDRLKTEGKPCNVQR